jgi:hypothetical protein
MRVTLPAAGGPYGNFADSISGTVGEDETGVTFILPCHIISPLFTKLQINELVKKINMVTGPIFVQFANRADGDKSFFFGPPVEPESITCHIVPGNAKAPRKSRDKVVMILRRAVTVDNIISINDDAARVSTELAILYTPV